MRPEIKVILDKLTKHPQVKYSYTNDSVSVEPIDENGFNVEFAVNDREIIISTDLWHEHFDKEGSDEALNCFAFMLSDACRLKIEYRAQRAVKATIESSENGEWIGGSTTGLFDLRFWKKKKVAYFQNALLKGKS